MIFLACYKMGHSYGIHYSVESIVPVQGRSLYALYKQNVHGMTPQALQDFLCLLYPILNAGDPFHCELPT